MPARRPRIPRCSSTPKIDSHFAPSEGTKLLRMPCTRGVAPVSIEVKAVTVRAG